MSEENKAVEKELTVEDFGFEPKKLGNMDVLAVSKMIAKQKNEMIPLIKKLMPKEDGQKADMVEVGTDLMFNLLASGNEDIYNLLQRKSGVDREKFDEADPASLVVLIKWLGANSNLNSFFKAASASAKAFPDA